MSCALKTCQSIALKQILNGDQIRGRGNNIDLEMANQCFKNIFPQGFRDIVHLVDILQEYGNAHFCLFRYYLNVKHKLDLPTSCQQSLFRQIWLLSDSKDDKISWQLLAKGSFWDDNLHRSIGWGKTLTPPISYIDNATQSHMYVAVEQQCTCPYLEPAV